MMQQILVYFRKDYTVELFLDLLRTSKELKFENCEIALYKANEDGELMENTMCFDDRKLRDYGIINFALKIINGGIDMGTPIESTTKQSSYHIVYSDRNGNGRGLENIENVNSISHSSKSMGTDFGGIEHKRNSCCDKCIIL